MGNKPNSPPSFNPNQGDIPEVIRDQPVSSSSSLLPWRGLIAGGIGVGVVAIMALIILLPRSQPTPDTGTLPPPASPAPSPTPIDNVLGHLAYDEAPPSELKAITLDGRLKLRQAAADQFLKMQAAAKAQGIALVPISAFRTVAQQNQLFFEVKKQRNQETRQRAEVSAPPGYSEHHTGYAVDIGDGSAQGTHLSEGFAETKAFQWLKNNAAKYSFELSFPPNNPQGVTYEPWHWRYVGDRQSLELFYKARNLPQSPSAP